MAEVHRLIIEHGRERAREMVPAKQRHLVDMAAEVMPFVPRFVIRTKMNSLEKIARVSCPVLVVHSPADEVVPYRLGRRLYDAAPGPKRFHEIKGAPHNLTHDVGGADYVSALREFIDSACQQKN